MVLKENDYAPVFIPTLCRFEHFKRCVDSLSKCSGAGNTTLIIGLDYPSKENHWEGYKKIKDYIKSITCFKEVVVLERQENYGAIKNINESINFIYEKWDQYIFSEDDNEFSPNFLEYINKGLLLYKDDMRVLAVCGYLYPSLLGVKGDNAMWITGYSAWGVGLWKNRRNSNRFYFTNEGIDSILSSWRNSLKLFRYAPKEVNSLITMRTRNIMYGDVVFNSICHIYDKGSIFPTKSKVRNWGDDGSGLHCIHNVGLSMQEIDDECHFDYETENHHLMRFTPHKLHFGIKMVILCRYIIYRLTGKDFLACHYSDRKE